MPADYDISVRGRIGTDVRSAEQGSRRQQLDGFDDAYVDIVDYIIRITDRIWDDQDVGYIYDSYSQQCRITDDTSQYQGVERVVESTVAAIHAFPDARHYADDVIWAGDSDTGFATSHRFMMVANHLGAWRWGPATGLPINSWGLANCIAKNNLIHEEWVLYNSSARLAQLGIDVRAAARIIGNSANFLPLAERLVGETERLRGGRIPDRYPVRDADAPFDPSHFVRALYHDSFNRRDFSAIERAYAPNVRWYGGSNRSGTTRGEVRTMTRALLATFPDFGVQVDDVYWMGNDEDGYSISVRWTGAGTHRGYALYGQPTGRRVHLWGLAHLYVHDGVITEEWSLFNEFDVLAQLLRDEDPSDWSS